MASQGADGEMKGATAAGWRGADGARTAAAASGTTPENGAVHGSARASENASKASPAGTEASRTGTRSFGAAAGPAGGESVRVDAWIWSVRLVKTRSIGATACKGGHVRVNGERVKPAYSVRVGDEVRVWHEGRERVVVVKRVIR